MPAAAAAAAAAGARVSWRCLRRRARRGCKSARGRSLWRTSGRSATRASRCGASLSSARPSSCARSSNS
eukprot:117327-Prymnesium_polylepis.1